MPFKGISYPELWQPFCSAECNHMCNFGRGYYGIQFCEIILNLGQWLRRRCLLKDFLSEALWWSGTIHAILKESIMGNIIVKSVPVVQEMSFKDISYLELWQPLCSVDWNHLCNFGRQHHEEQSCEILNLDNGSGGNAI